jgi:hypothetical protein
MGIEPTTYSLGNCRVEVYRPFRWKWLARSSELGSGQPFGKEFSTLSSVWSGGLILAWRNQTCLIIQRFQWAFGKIEQPAL